MLKPQGTLVVAQVVAKLAEQAEAARQRGKRIAEETYSGCMVCLGWVFFQVGQHRKKMI